LENSKNQTTAQQEDTMHGRYITFALDQEEYGIEIRYVTEIIGMQPITPLPETPEYVRGIVNLRGKVIPVIDMRQKFRNCDALFMEDEINEINKTVKE